MAKVAAIPVVASVSGEAALEVGKVQVAAAARALAPKRTGRMAAGIVPVHEGVAALVDYTRFPESGTVFIQAQHFMEEAAERVGPIVTREITEVVTRALYAL